MRTLAALGVALVALTGACAHPTPGQRPPVITSAPAPVVGPARIDIDTINAHSTLIPLGLQPDGALEVPDVHHPQQAGWYCVNPVLPQPAKCVSGVIPGQVGPAVIVGHVDGDHQQGVFYNLKNLGVGDTARVTLVDDRVLTFEVYRVLRAAKTAFPAQVVYGDTVGPELRLITCSGDFVGGVLGYADNTIVFAQLIPTPPEP